MSLFKLVPKNPYYYWSVMSIVMQVSSSCMIMIHGHMEKSSSLLLAMCFSTALMILSLCYAGPCF